MKTFVKISTIVVAIGGLLSIMAGDSITGWLMFAVAWLAIIALQLEEIKNV